MKRKRENVQDSVRRRRDRAQRYAQPMGPGGAVIDFFTGHTRKTSVQTTLGSLMRLAFAAASLRLNLYRVSRSAGSRARNLIFSVPCVQRATNLQRTHKRCARLNTKSGAMAAPSKARMLRPFTGIAHLPSVRVALLLFALMLGHAASNPLRRPQGSSVSERE